MGKFQFRKKEKSAREESKAITDGIKPAKHLGKHTFETIYQEIVSLANQKPMFRDRAWFKQSRNIRAEILNGIANQQRNYQQLILFLNSIEVQR